MKCLFFTKITIFCGMIMFSACKHDCPPVPETPSNLKIGLMGHYPFTGNPGDSSGQGNHGTANGAVLTSDRFGNANSAYSFDGTNDYISLPVTNFLNSNYTYSAWIKVMAHPGNNNLQGILSVGNTAGDQTLTNTENYFNGVSGLGLQGYFVDNTSVSTNSNVLTSLNTWYLITGVRDNTNLKLYINGTFISNVSTGGKATLYSASPNAIIGARSNLVQFFNGSIDDVRIYNRALTTEEVIQLYQLK